MDASHNGDRVSEHPNTMLGRDTMWGRDNARHHVQGWHVWHVYLASPLEWSKLELNNKRDESIWIRNICRGFPSYPLSSKLFWQACAKNRLIFKCWHAFVKEDSKGCIYSCLSLSPGPSRRQNLIHAFWARLVVIFYTLSIVLPSRVESHLFVTCFIMLQFDHDSLMYCWVIITSTRADSCRANCLSVSLQNCI